MHVKRWECESQGDKGCLKADCSVNGRCERKHRVKQFQKRCFARLLELPAVGQWSPRALFEDMVETIALCLVVGCFNIWASMSEAMSRAHCAV